MEVLQGVDHMDLDLIKRNKIKCFDISKEFKLINSFTATSELAFSLILALNRKIIPAIEDSKRYMEQRKISRLSTSR